MSNILQLAAQLKQWFPGMDPLACLPFVREGYQDIRRSRKWSFLKKNGRLFAPAPVTTGTVSVTQFSPTVVADATAAPALNAIATATAPAWPIVQQQFRINGGPIYNIINWVYNSPSAGLGTMTLDQNYAEITQSGQPYMVYQPYQIAPATDFDMWLSCVDYSSGYRFRRRNLYRKQEEVDRRDPYRLDFSWPIWFAAHDYINVTSAGVTSTYPRFEMWPGPTDQRGYVVEYMIRGDNVADTDTLPGIIDDQLIITRARHYGYQFMMTQENITANQIKAIASQQGICDKKFNDDLQQTKKSDDDVFNSTYFENEDGPDLSGPLDANYLMDHDVFLVY